MAFRNTDKAFIPEIDSSRPSMHECVMRQEQNPFKGHDRVLGIPYTAETITRIEPLLLHSRFQLLGVLDGHEDAEAADFTCAHLPLLIDDQLAAMPEADQTEVVSALRDATEQLRRRARGEAVRGGVVGAFNLYDNDTDTMYLYNIGDTRQYLLTWSGAIMRPFADDKPHARRDELSRNGMWIAGNNKVNGSLGVGACLIGCDEYALRYPKGKNGVELQPRIQVLRDFSVSYSGGLINCDGLSLGKGGELDDLSEVHELNAAMADVTEDWGLGDLAATIWAVTEPIDDDKTSVSFHVGR